MNIGNYVVVRFNPDPARNEWRNIGVLLWDDADFRLKIDSESAKKIVRENPQLHATALDWVDEFVRTRIAQMPLFSSEQVKKIVCDDPGFPLSFSEPLRTALEPSELHPLDSTLAALIGRMVRPRARVTPKNPNPVKDLTERFAPLIEGKLVQKDYEFTQSRSGLNRVVNFYANSDANIVLEALQLDLQNVSANAIRSRADAEANKINDIREKNPDVRFLVYCGLSDRVSLREANQEALSIIRAANADVETDMPAVAQRFESVIIR